MRLGFSAFDYMKTIGSLEECSENETVPSLGSAKW